MFGWIKQLRDWISGPTSPAKLQKQAEERSRRVNNFINKQLKDLEKDVAVNRRRGTPGN
jgi:hypothetical protein